MYGVKLSTFVSFRSTTSRQSSGCSSLSVRTFFFRDKSGPYTASASLCPQNMCCILSFLSNLHLAISFEVTNAVENGPHTQCHMLLEYSVPMAQ